MHMDQALAIIAEEIRRLDDTGPGRFEASVWRDGHGGEYLALVYRYAIPEGDGTSQPPEWWPLPGPEWEDIDDPWKRWGGDDLIAALEALGFRHRDGDVENYEGIYSDAAILDYEGRDEDEEVEDA